MQLARHRQSGLLAPMREPAASAFSGHSSILCQMSSTNGFWSELLIKGGLALGVDSRWLVATMQSSLLAVECTIRRRLHVKGLLGLSAGM